METPGEMFDFRRVYMDEMERRKGRRAHPVLDVGSGSRPLHDADVLCDAFRERSIHRVDSSATVDDRPFVVCDLQHLPFTDRAFAFVHCSHVVEHMEDPRMALAELMRVSASGYVETPAPLGEVVLFGNPAHRWVVSSRKGRLLVGERKRLTVRGRTILPLGYLMAPAFRTPIGRAMVSGLDYAFPGLMLTRFRWQP